MSDDSHPPDDPERRYRAARAQAEQRFNDAIRTAWTLHGQARWAAVQRAQDRLAADLESARRRVLGQRG
jgi:hypothetical protein